MGGGREPTYRGGNQLNVDKSRPGPKIVHLNFTADGEQLIFTRLGVAKSAVDGAGPVFFADLSYDQFSGRARINGFLLADKLD